MVQNINLKKIMKKLSALCLIALILLIVGGLNWALVGLFSFDLVAYVFGAMSLLAKIVYVLVGASALVILFSLGKLGRKA